MALRGRGLDERYARAPEHARGIVLVEQNRADRIMAYGADAMGEEQPAFVEFDGRAAIADLDELPRIFGLNDYLDEAPFVEVVRQDAVPALIVVARDHCIAPASLSRNPSPPLVVRRHSLVRFTMACS